MNIEHTLVKNLRPYPKNARTHSKKQVQQIARSIERFRFCNPVLIDADGQIIAGHGRVAAAKLLGMEAVPTVRLSHLSEVDKRAYILADNKMAEKAGWDREILAIELQSLAELGFDFDLTGFETSRDRFDYRRTGWKRRQGRRNHSRIFQWAGGDPPGQYLDVRGARPGLW